jgi:hypothetical protein
LFANYFAQLTERMSGSLKIEIRSEAETIFTRTYPIDILAYDQWGGINIFPEMLAAFITPNHAVLVSKYYVEIGKQTLKLKQEVTQDILNENKDFLMDAMDREMLIEKVLTRVRNINGNILYIILRLENAKKIPYLYQVPVLRNYINVDKAIVGDIIQKYKYVFN